MADPERFAFERVATPAHTAITVGEVGELPDDVKWKPAKHLLYVNERVTRACLAPHQTFLDLEIAVRHGKALALDTPVPTPGGWSTIGSLHPGDEVFDENGEVCRVVAKSRVFKDRPCFTVATDDGDSIIADAEHEWPVTLSDSYHNRPPEVGGRCPLCPAEFDRPRGLSAHMGRKHGTTVLREREVPATYTSADLAERRVRHLTRGRSDRPRSSMSAVLKTDSPVLPVDPWLLGLWLGDGSTGSGQITVGDCDSAFVIPRIVDLGYTVTRYKAPQLYHVRGLHADLAEVGVLHRKRLPPEYLRAAAVDRLALLQGLIDSDGHVAPKGQVEFCNTNKELALGVQELVRSLGYKASLVEGRATLYGVDCGAKYRVLFYMPDAASIPRKRERCIDPVRRDRFLTVEPCSPRDTQCIQVDSPSHQFLAGRGMVPTHNSLLVSGYLPFWYLGMFPDRRVALVSYNADFASEWGDFTRELVELYGPELFGIEMDPRKKAKHTWGVKGRRGGVVATGVNGKLTGKGYDLIVIDDPIKNREQADSAAERKTLRSGYYSNIRTRLMQQGTMILTMARWREDDLAGDVVHGYSHAEGADSTGADDWEIIRLPALAEPAATEKLTDGERAVWRDELGRKEGEALWPEAWPEDALAKLRASITLTEPDAWDSLYQQNPSAKEGKEFKVDTWITLPHVDRSRLRLVRFWDLAATKGGGDWTVGMLVGMDSDNKTYVLDVQRFRKDSAEVEKHVRMTAEHDGISVPVRIEQEKSGSGKALASTYTRLLVGFDVDAKQPDGSKEARASAVASQQQQGRVILLRSEWNALLIEEARTFPNGRWDDQIDALSGGFNFLALAGPSSMETEYQLNTPLASLYGNQRPRSLPGATALDRARASVRG